MTESRPQLALLLLAALLYPLIEGGLALWHVSVDPLFLLLFWIAIRRGELPAIVYGFALGLFRDLGDFSQLGASALAFTLGGFAIARLRDKIDRDNLPIRLLLLCLSYLFVQAVFLLPRSDWSLIAAFMAWLRFAPLGGLFNVIAYLISLLLIWILREGLALLHEPAARR